AHAKPVAGRSRNDRGATGRWWLGRFGFGGRLADERQQVLVDLVLQGRAHAVRRALVDLEPGVLDDLRRQHRRRSDRHDLVVVAVQYQDRHFYLIKVLGRVRLGERLDAEVARRETRHHALQPEGVA